MDEAGGRCHFCGAGATFRASPSLYVCEPCAVRVAHLATDEAANIWAAHGAPPPRRGSTGSAEEIETERVFEDLKEGVARLITDDDADVHFHLAHAYSEMGLYLDARREAGVAIRARAQASTTEAALRLLLTSPLLSSEGMRRLRERLRRTLH